MHTRRAPTRGTAPDLLGRPFALLAFDWDGTAVVDRREDATPLRLILEQLLRREVIIAIITGTNFQNIDRQCTAAIGREGKEFLFVLTNRGSEVYGFDRRGRPRILWRREASPTEDDLLTRAANSVRDTLADRTGLEIGVVYDRLNRRKIDLIPLPAWRDPPKSEIGELIVAVETRLRDAGLEGGIRDAFSLAEETVRRLGLVDARITSDVKHIEIGLTDKSDSVRWLLSNVAAPRGLEIARILIAGDEFGPIAGFPGSDAKLIVPEAEGAVYLSVGPEPNGVPEGVIHLGGGPARFRDLLEEQVVLHGIEPTSDPTCRVVEEGFNLAREHEIEALFTVSNGYLGTRGSLAEGSSLSAPATYIAGVYANPKAPRTIPGLARAPDWMHLEAELDGHEIRLEGTPPLEHRRILDLRQGLIWREWRHEDASGRITRIRGVRAASLADRHLLIQQVTLTPENHDSTLRVTTRLQAFTADDDPPTDLLVGVEPTPQLPNDDAGGTLVLEAVGSGVRVAFVTSTTLRAPPGEEFEATLARSHSVTRQRWEGRVRAGEDYRFDRVVSVFTTREVPDPEVRALAHLREAEAKGTDILLAEHLRAWSERWHSAAVYLEGDDFSARAIHFASYHLIGAADPGDDRVSIGARALTGEVYKGHVFWDTEIFMLPFYTLTYPEAARALLGYRYHSLPRAREKARLFGFRGALFAWESAIDGLEATPPIAITPDGTVIRIRSGEQEHHISADVAYGVWQYWQLTGDDDFFLDRGAEIIIETARFWASRGRIEADGLYHIRHVIGPDEYHEDVDDNAFTNVMALWNMERGAETARILRSRWPERWRELAERIRIEDDEPATWERLAAATYTGFDPDSGLFEQFAGYHGLEEIDLREYEPRSAPMDLLLGRERTQRSKVVKQADVVLLIYLLWDRFPPAVRRANFLYYEPRCGHGSSLSPGIHALVAARLGEIDLADRYFRQTAEIDLANNMGNAAGGVHIGALGTLWQAAIFGYGGLYPQGASGLLLDPRIPAHWEWLDYRIRWRGRSVAVSIDQGGDRVEARMEDGEPMEITIRGQPPTRLEPGGPPARS